ncbi:MAG: copper amine oxidase N-terminal domain-containing protein [Oscillospiraceae bacterium]|nr:copper amine oxidase N-terminal domain-containing protein [Oscillospiraceae bacterium]
MNKRPPARKPPPKKRPPQKKKKKKQIRKTPLKGSTAKRIDPRLLETRRKQQAKRKYYKKQQRIRAIKILFNRFIVLVITFVILLLLTVGLFFVNLFWHDNVNSARYTYEITTIDGNIRRRMSYNQLFYHNSPYINMTELAEIYDLIITGDVNIIRFVTTGEERNDVKFYIDSSMAYINGVPVRLSSPVYADGLKVYVPLKFFTDYVSGLDIFYNIDQSRLSIKRIEIVQENKPKDIKYADIEFKLKENDPTSNILEGSLDNDLLILTDPNRGLDESIVGEE